MDVQGPEVVTPWAKKYGVTFPVAVDTADVFGAAFGLKAIPISFLVDEVGIIRLQGGGPSKEFRAQVEEILREPVSGVRGQARGSVAALSLKELRARATRTPDDADARLALAQALERAGDYAAALAECEAAARSRPADATIPFTHGLVLLRQGKTNDALLKVHQSARPGLGQLAHPQTNLGAGTPGEVLRHERHRLGLAEGSNRARGEMNCRPLLNRLTS